VYLCEFIFLKGVRPGLPISASRSYSIELPRFFMSAFETEILIDGCLSMGLGDISSSSSSYLELSESLRL
jgi:hypothetical protein